MKYSLKSFAAGVGSGIATYAVSGYALGYTMAFAMPTAFSSGVWEAMVVFGLGATLIALVFQFAAIHLLRSKLLAALLGFATSLMAALLVTDQFAVGYKAMTAWCVGALLASAAQKWLRSNNSFKPKPLRGSA